MRRRFQGPAGAGSDRTSGRCQAYRASALSEGEKPSQPQLGLFGSREGGHRPTVPRSSHLWREAGTPSFFFFRNQFLMGNFPIFKCWQLTLRQMKHTSRLAVLPTVPQLKRGARGFWMAARPRPPQLIFTEPDRTSQSTPWSRGRAVPEPRSTDGTTEVQS